MRFFFSFKKIAVNLGLVILSAFFFAGSFPNPVIEKGLPLLAWIAYVPVFILIRRSSLPESVCWGGLYGYAAYGLFNYWLGAFHPLAGMIVGLIYFVFLAAVFFFLKLADIFFPRRGYIVQWVIWISYEYLRTLGFLGYSYGITGYSQWTLLPVIQIADLFGVWGVSALVVFPSVFIAAVLVNGRFAAGTIRKCIMKEKIPALLWTAALILTLVYGAVSPVDYSSAPAARLALIQLNADPWKAEVPGMEMEQYRENLSVLRRLSDEALREEPRPDLVVWSETAFVPRIYWHTTYRDDHESWVLVRELLRYLTRQDVPFLLGNDDARKDPVKNPEKDHRVDYNAVMLYTGGEVSGIYRKLRLVPFTEYFPYKKQLPWLYNTLAKADTHFWEKGSDETIFSVPFRNGGGNFKFSSPICFEDTFGYLSRNFVRGGSELIVNLSNDAWSKSLSAQNQHLSMAVFRAVENRRSMARSTASGQTCGIDPNGKILAMAAPFTESWITVELPVVTPDTLYTAWGDFLPLFFLAAAFLLLISGLLLRIVKLNGVHGKGRKTADAGAQARDAVSVDGARRRKQKDFSAG
ncbi:MAG: apolipoprotein N-acyltransferase [Treponema sp.]|jgi:apolipoprotein N-acyltransferase|nr:apolipoprotein N-acyltransferase [Treponema sp.]